LDAQLPVLQYNTVFFFSPIPVKALCKDCVVERCRILRLKNQLNEDYKTVTNLLKITVKGSDGFWVGKASLRSWRQLALEQLNEQDEGAEHSNGKLSGNAPNKDGANKKKREKKEELNFNEDIVCPHGKSLRGMELNTSVVAHCSRC
ncbi:ubiquitin carboxyl-terminal hydrolase 48-like, partial [Lagopus leucura]|uniref:ubiquitin carboxyl-terminal hydrolase 48-like n=1 Tax=Lagopus leucura TaxID=30410 RepID=UPI001C670A1C